MKKKTSATSALIALSLSLGFFTNNTHEVLASELEKASEEEIVEVFSVGEEADVDTDVDTDAARNVDDSGADADTGEETDPDADVETDASEETYSDVDADAGTDTGEEINPDAEVKEIEEEVEEEVEVEEVKDGIVNEDGNTYYYKNGERVTGWIDHGYTDMQWDYETDDYIEVWVNNWFYFNPTTGAMETGWTDVNGKWYYLNYNGSMVTGESYIDGKEYYFEESGAMVTGWKDHGYLDYQWDDNSKKNVEVWISDWKYYHATGEQATGWIYDGSNYYYFTSWGSMVKGTETIGRTQHEFSASGTWQGQWVRDNKGFWFKDAKGNFPKNQWKEVGNEWYYFNNNGYVTTGWQKISNKWYYFNDLGQMMQDEQHKINDKTYRFNKSGAMITGWYNAGFTYIQWDEESEKDVEVWVNRWEYYHASGEAATDWLRDGNKWYYFESGRMYSDTQATIDGEIYFFKDSGAMRTQGWYDDGEFYSEWNEDTQESEEVWVENWYYISNSGQASTGWDKINNTWYYFTNWGSLVTGERIIDRKVNVFSSSGAWQGNWEENNKGIWFKDAKGNSLKNEWIKLADTWYHFDNNGYVDTEWAKIGNDWYYFDELGRMYSEEYTEIDGREYRFEKSGALFNGWHDNHYTSTEWVWDEELEDYVGIEKNITDWEYYTTDGKITDGWKEIDGEWYYFEYGSMVTGELYIEGALHEFAENGVWLGKIKN